MRLQGARGTTWALSTLVRLALHLLPKYLMSRTARALASIPLPAPLRPLCYRTYATLTGADLTGMQGTLRDYRNLRAFFQRPLQASARPIAQGPLVWPCDGRIVTSGPIDGDRIPQIKGVDYTLAELLGDVELAAALRGGTQATIYLAPADYHRVHAPFAAAITATRALPGALFPVNPPAVRAIPRLFARNARLVFRCQLPDGRIAAVVMVAALMVTDSSVSCPVPGAVERGDEIGRFGFGSTVVAILPRGEEQWPALPPGHPVKMGGAVPPPARTKPA